MPKRCNSCDELKARVERLEKRLDSAEDLASKWHAQWQKEHERRQKAEGIIALRDVEISQLRKKIEKLEAQVHHLQKMLFAKSSEATQQSEDIELADAVGLPVKRARGKQPGAQGFGRRIRSEIEEVIEVQHDIKQLQKCCPRCRAERPLLPFTEDSEEIDYQWRLVRIKHKRLKYGRTCKCKGVTPIVTAPVPAKIIPKGLFSTSFWTHVLIEKYLLQRPISKIALSLSLQGLRISDGSLSSGLKYLTKLFARLYNEIRLQSRSALHWSMDETHWRVFVDTVGKDNHKWWLWVALTDDTMLFMLDPTRSSNVPTNHLRGISAGFLSCDRYSSYKPVSENISLSYCWAHVRRDFLKLENYPTLKRFANRWVTNIDLLFHQNKLRLHAKGTRKYARENAKLKQLVDSMHNAWKRDLSRQTHTEAIDVLTSLEVHWNGLTLFVKHPNLPMDNNASERALRGPVVGRKNYYGNHSIWGGHLAAMLFSIFGTIGKFKLDPYQYLSEYLQCCAKNGGRPPDDLSDFLPWKMSAQRKQELALPTVA